MRRGVGLIAVAAIGLAGCGSSGKVVDRVNGRLLTIYTSVPLHGASAVNGVAVARGAMLALDHVHGRVGEYRVIMRTLDDSTPQHRQWDPGQTTDNAHKAMADKTTIGYIGEFNSGASAVSIPLLNRDGIPQISPASTAVGLTSNAAGADPGEPEKYYPTKVRTFARVVPTDAVEARAQVKLQRSLGCVKTYVLDDDEFDGSDTAASFSVAAHAAGLDVVAVQPYDPGATDYRSLARDVARSGANCVLISAITESHAVLLTRQIAEEMPRARIFGTAGLAESTFTEPDQGGIPLALDPRVLVTVAALPPGAYPPSGQAFYAAYARRVRPARAVRHVRLRSNEPDARLDRTRDRLGPPGGATVERRRGPVRHSGSAGDDRDLQHQPERGHHAGPLRRLPDC
jgi:branched-chain amino acid transport system substrate-binding protein